MSAITSIAECVAMATQLKRDWFSHEPTWGPWFRGHSDVTWKLTPKLYRVTPPMRGIRIIEDEIRQEFIMRTPGLAETGPLTSWEWYFMMQHFGAPTRLLDWTEGALIALYFAVRDNNGDADAAMWMLRSMVAKQDRDGRARSDSTWGRNRNFKKGFKSLQAMVAGSVYEEQVTNIARRCLPNPQCKKNQHSKIVLHNPWFRQECI
jgi:hypothetical protein